MIAQAVESYLTEHPLDVPAKTSDLQNDSDFQTGTQVQSTVNAAIAGITHFHFLKVEELPVSGEDNIIYLVPGTQKENDNYDEYLYADGAWELIGNTDVDLSGYVLKSEIPSAIKNPNKLSIKIGGVVVAEYDGSGAVTVTIPDAEGGAATERIEKLSTDTVVELRPNKLYIFPEMETLTYTLAQTDNTVAEEFHFIFQSGQTPTEVVHPSGMNVGSLTVEANKIYEISVLESCLTSQSWVVS